MNKFWMRGYAYAKRCHTLGKDNPFPCDSLAFDGYAYAASEMTP